MGTPGRLVWDKLEERQFEGGVDQVVIYYPNATTGVYDDGEVWNGCTNVDNSPSGGEATAFWADNMKYAELDSTEEWAGTVNAYTYPERFGQCDGSYELATGVSIGQQSRKSFGLSYRTKVGNAQDGFKSYIIHCVYGCKAAPSQKTYNTINDSPEIIEFSWALTTTPVQVPGCKPTASLDIDSAKVGQAGMTAIENVLYGTDPTTDPVSAGTVPRLPLPAEIAQIISSAIQAAG